MHRNRKSLPEVGRMKKQGISVYCIVSPGEDGRILEMDGAGYTICAYSCIETAH